MLSFSHLKVMKICFMHYAAEKGCHSKCDVTKKNEFAKLWDVMSYSIILEKKTLPKKTSIHQ